MTLEIPRAINTRASVYESLGNNDRRIRRSKATRLLRNAFMDRCNHTKRPRWISRANHCLFDSLIRPRLIKGAIVQHLTSKFIWALGHELMIWAGGPTFSPTKASAQVHNNYQSKLGVFWVLGKRTAGAPLACCPRNHFRALYTCPVTSPFECSTEPLGNSAAEHICCNGNHSQSQPLVPKNPLKFIDIGPLFALRKKIMMITPLTRAINRRNE